MILYCFLKSDKKLNNKVRLSLHFFICMMMNKSQTGVRIVDQRNRLQDLKREHRRREIEAKVKKQNGLVEEEEEDGVEEEEQFEEVRGFDLSQFLEQTQKDTKIDLVKFKRAVSFLVNQDLDDLSDLRIYSIEQYRLFNRKLKLFNTAFEEHKKLQKNLEVEEPSTEPLPLLNISNTVA